MAALLYDELLKLYCQFSQEAIDSAESYEANDEALDALRDAIISLASPKTVLDVMALPEDELQRDGFVHLIERDATDHYDQIDGFIQLFYGDIDIPTLITPEQYAFNGYDLCEWILQKGL